MKMICALAVYLGHGITAFCQEGSFSLVITKGPPPEISWPSQTGFQYQLQVTPSLAQQSWQSLGPVQSGTGAMLSFKDAQGGLAPRYYRALRTGTGTGTSQISQNAVAPQSGVIYPEKTIIGSAALGLQFTVPAAWKGGVRDGTATMLFASDTEPGLVLGFFSLAGDAAFIARLLGNDFTTSDGTFQVTRAPEISGDRVVVEWALLGQNVSLRLVARVHPSGGAVAFAGFFTEPNRAIMQRVLDDFAQSTMTVPRATRSDLIQLISGKAFSWAKSSSTGSGGTSGSLSRWSRNNAFFCPGTYEITTYSESSYSGTLSGGGFYGGGSSSTSTEAGDWTIIDSQLGPILVMISASGIQSAVITVSGNAVHFGDQEFSYSGPHNCTVP